ncbi:fructose-bisphosphate aldolase [Alkalihalobacillus sp. AL-G]|uniref:fructose-bisphosphate aldolase n=1 Tax=Alkalihalobacillus sp. AL-G TaxID=2926399 RepID=UPI00272A56A7|nr:fructose-bisphosphate aldolase [Alkalihalobacillus sp. AL-G]WLD94374.1 fructose-bisphosphate aldolase [Alkalihalobacillus sp. AL-G]
MLGQDACNFINGPIINIDVHVATLTDEEYDSVGTSWLENPTKDDFRKFTFNLEMKHSESITFQKIDIPRWKQIIDSIDRKRYWFGGGFNQDNTGENFARSGWEFVFYSKGLENAEIKQAFESQVLMVSWETIEGEPIKKEFTIGRLIEFTNE